MDSSVCSSCGFRAESHGSSNTEDCRSNKHTRLSVWLDPDFSPSFFNSFPSYQCGLPQTRYNS